MAGSLCAGRTLLEQRPANVHIISRLRMDAVLWTPPPRRRKGQTGRPRRRGVRLPTPTALVAACRRWRTVTLTIYVRTVTAQVVACRALWYVALRDQPVRVVVVQDPTGKRKDEAFFCADVSVEAALISEMYARRWMLEVTFHDTEQYLGFEDAQIQTVREVRRTASLAGGYYLVLLWAAGCARAGHPVPALTRPWYRTKTIPSFLDLLTALRHETGGQDYSDPPTAAPRPQNHSPRCHQARRLSA